ncbi:MAG: precorrin-8X methylmutase [Nitrospirota bacterium]
MEQHEIERKSFEIIDSLIGKHNFTEKELAIVKRVIHTIGDIDFGRELIIHPEAIDKGISAIKSGNNIVTDVNMVKAGVREKTLNSFGGRLYCFVNDNEVIKKSADKKKTRSALGMQKAMPELNNGIVAIGNAPTALFEIIRLIRDEGLRPALIVGVPVGFIDAAESKEELLKVDVPYITNKGRKGGSPVAVAIINALIILAKECMGE